MSESGLRVEVQLVRVVDGKTQTTTAASGWIDEQEWGGCLPDEQVGRLKIEAGDCMEVCIKQARERDIWIGY